MGDPAAALAVHCGLPYLQTSLLLALPATQFKDGQAEVASPETRVQVAPGAAAANRDREKEVENRKLISD